MRTRRHTVLEVLAAGKLWRAACLADKIQCVYAVYDDHELSAGRYAILSLVIFLAALAVTTIGATVRAYHINQQ